MHTAQNMFCKEPLDGAKELSQSLFARAVALLMCKSTETDSADEDGDRAWKKRRREGKQPAEISKREWRNMVQDVSYLNPFLITTRHHRACVVFYPQLLLSLFRCLVQQKLITDEVIKLRKEVKELQEKKQMVNVAALILTAVAKVN